MTWRQMRQSQQQADSQYESEAGDSDVPASQLADKDSLFIQCNGLSVHYKQAYPTTVRLLLYHHILFQSSYSSIFCF